MEKEAVMTEQNIDNAKKKTVKKKKRSARYYLIELIVKIGIVGLVLWILLEFVVMISVCHDNTAYPMIKDGDFCLTYRLAELRQGDEITYIKDDKVRDLGANEDLCIDSPEHIFSILDSAFDELKELIKNELKNSF